MNFPDGDLRGGIEHTQTFDLIAEELGTHGAFGVRAPDIQHAAAHGKLAGR